jgi:hypothetical protein
MIDFMQAWGWWGVFAMAAWPNAAFDLCGICCGAFRMPFWTFFTAVVAGKAVVKVTGQAVACILFFSPTYQARATETVAAVAEVLSPAAAAKIRTGVQRWVAKFDASASAVAVVPGGGAVSLDLKAAWNAVITAFVGSFVLSAISQFAQLEQAAADEREVAEHEAAEAGLRGRRKEKSRRARR